MPNPTAECALILSLLKTYFPVDCVIAGESNVENIANGVSLELRTAGGNKYSVSQALIDLAAAANFIDAVIGIIKELRKKKESIPSPQELNRIFHQTVNINIKASDEAQVSICKDVIDRLPADPPSETPG